MRLLKQALGVFGTLVVLAVMAALVAPKTAHGVAAALVRMEPGTTSEVGLNESQVVSLACFTGYNYCITINPEGVKSASAYVVPSGYTLIVTDYQFSYVGLKPGMYDGDYLVNSSTGNALASGAALSDQYGDIYGHEHYATGIRVAPGVTIADSLATLSNIGVANVQGYLVRN